MDKSTGRKAKKTGLQAYKEALYHYDTKYVELKSTTSFDEMRLPTTETEHRVHKV